MRYSRYKILVSVITMLTITSIVSVGAGIIIGSGIASKNSNINFANRFIRKTDFNLSVNKAYAGIQRLINQNLTPNYYEPQYIDENAINMEVEQIEETTVCDNTIISVETFLVDYLKNNNIPATFEDRNNLARSYGIENYTGTQEENDLFLRMLIGDEEPQNQPECYK